MEKSAGKKNDNKPDEEILACFADVFQAMGITESDIEAELYDFNLPELVGAEREKLGSREGLLVTRDTMANMESAEPCGHIMYKGRPVLVYLRDQFLRKERYYQGHYNPFHICFCKALRDAKKEHRYEGRYVMTYDISGSFLVNMSIRDKDSRGRVYTEKKEQGVYIDLNVCQDCLHETGWKNFNAYIGPGVEWYKGGNFAMRRKLVASFSIREFLQEARKQQKLSYKLEELQGSCVKGSALTAIEKKYALTPQMKADMKKARDFCCDICHRKFTEKQLEIHHINHNEGDNRSENLLVICETCHDAIHNEEGGLREQLDSEREISELEYAHNEKSLGDLHRQGLGVQRNERKAQEHYDHAVEGYESLAQEGNAEARISLGSMYHDGIGVKENKKKATTLFKKAEKTLQAEVGKENPDACRQLAKLYSEGWGVKQDEAKAEKLKQEAYKGYLSQVPLSAEQSLHASEVAPTEEAERLQAQAASLYNLRAQQGDAMAGLRLAMLQDAVYDDSDEVEPPETESAYQQAAKALENMAEQFEVNQSVEKTAIKAEAGDSKAIERLGKMYAKGKAEALEPLKRLAFKGNKNTLAAIEAKANAGDMDAIMAMADIAMRG